MIFFFGGSRSWAAREARRKARLMAKKKRVALMKTTVGIFSFFVLSICLWSLMKMRVSRRKGISNENIGNTSYVASNVNVKEKIEMPRPPPEPLPPVGRNDSGVDARDGVHGYGESNDGVRVGAFTKARMEMGDNVSSRVMESGNRQVGDNVRSGFGESSNGGAVHGMVQEGFNGGSGGGSSSDNSHEEVLKQVEHGIGTGVGKRVMDIIDGEEGGEGVRISLGMRSDGRSGDIVGNGREVMNGHGHNVVMSGGDGRGTIRMSEEGHGNSGIGNSYEKPPNDVGGVGAVKGSVKGATMLGLGTVFKALLLLVNAMAILHEERFLRKVGWSEHEAAMDGGIKLQIVNLLKAFRVLRVPIIIVNTITVLVLLVIG